jgi:homoserine O-acetyltransferase
MLYARDVSDACGRPTGLQTFDSDEPLHLERGGRLDHVRVGYETWGTLDADASNAVLICHALTGDSHVASHGPGDTPGWWEGIVGPGKFLDTDHLFVVCSNTLGGCRGTTGPGDIDPATGKRYGANFPAITQHDAVAVQARLMDHLGVDRLAGVVGGSMGGQQALQWAVDHGERLAACCLIATGPRLTSQALAFDVVGRNAILRDPQYAGGDFYDASDGPQVGLALARMLAHITYLSRDGMTAKFDPERDQPRELVNPFAAGFEADYGVASYLAHQGDKFVQRFDANSYVALTRAMDRFDLGGSDAELLDGFASKTDAGTRFGIASFSSDWLFPPEQSRAMTRALSKAGRRTAYLEITSDAGHDAFLLPDEREQYGRFVAATVGLTRQVEPQPPRADFDAILDLVPPGVSVLDLGCGTGDLLDQLRSRGHDRLAGVEVVTQNVLVATERGLDVIDADLNRPLTFFGDDQFDIVVLSRTLQTVENTVGVLREVLRVGRRGIVSFPNFAHRPLRQMLYDQGRSPKSGAYEHAWYDSPNRRYPSLLDFRDLCDDLGLSIEREVCLDTATGEAVTDEPNLNADLIVVSLRG